MTALSVSSFQVLPPTSQLGGEPGGQTSATSEVREIASPIDVEKRELAYRYELVAELLAREGNVSPMEASPISGAERALIEDLIRRSEGIADENIAPLQMLLDFTEPVMGLVKVQYASMIRQMGIHLLRVEPSMPGIPR